MRLKVQALLCATVLAAATSASAQDKPPYTFEFHGLFGGSLALQDQQFKPGNFQQAWYPYTNNNTHKAIMGADIRQSQLAFGITGPQAFGGTPKGFISFDLSNGPGPSLLGGYTSAAIRLRFLYADLVLGNTTLRFGQDSHLVIGLVPTSVGNQDYPLSYNSGAIGWRDPGFFIHHKVPMGNMSLTLSAAILRAQWQLPQGALPSGVSDYSTTRGNTWTAPDGGLITMGEASGLPALEARMLLASKKMVAFAGAHWNRVHRNGPNKQEGTLPGTTDLDVIAAQGGLMLNMAPLIIQGGGYTGKNLTPLLGNLLQWPLYGDIHEWGAWGQLGMFFSKSMSLWAFAGTSHPNYTENLDNGATLAIPRGIYSPTLQNTRFTGTARWAQAGYQIGLEYSHWVTRKARGAGTLGVGTTGLINANQVMLSGMYAF